MKKEEMIFHVNGRQLTFENILKMVPEGWNNLLENGFKKMFENGWDGKIIQIKEKFGGLRIYLDIDDEKIHKTIDEMEEESTKICCVCGCSPAKNITNSWILYYCNEHFEKLKNK